MARTKQLNLIKDPRQKTKLWWIVKQGVYGGSLNYRKVRRPFDSKKLSHTVFKAALGRAVWFTRFEGTVREIIKQTAKRYGVRIKDIAVNRDHIHVLFYTASRESQTRFLRYISAELGRRYARLRARAGFRQHPLWVSRPFSRLVSWGRRSLQQVRAYIQRNRDEVLGFVEYKPRKHALAKFLNAWSAQRGLSSA